MTNQNIETNEVDQTARTLRSEDLQRAFAVNLDGTHAVDGSWSVGVNTEGDSNE